MALSPRAVIREEKGENVFKLHFLKSKPHPSTSFAADKEENSSHPNCSKIGK